MPDNAAFTRETLRSEIGILASNLNSAMAKALDTGRFVLNLDDHFPVATGIAPVGGGRLAGERGFIARQLIVPPRSGSEAAPAAPAPGHALPVCA